MIVFSLNKILEAVGGEMELHISANIEKVKLVTLYGESGAGKTSILRMLAGLMAPENGFIKINNKIWFDHKKNIDLKPQLRKIGFVFQDYALFPNMTVRQNIEFALDKNQDHDIINELIETIELGDLQHRKPDTLSGGQQQRTALARALVRQPELLLLDEPLSALGHDMRAKLQDYILMVHRQYKLTTILVSHELGEVLKMSDYVLELVNGRVQREGAPAEIFTEGNNKKSALHLAGDIVKIEDGEMTVLIGNRLVGVPRKNGLRVGDRLVLGVGITGNDIRKIG